MTVRRFRFSRPIIIMVKPSRENYRVTHSRLRMGSPEGCSKWPTSKVAAYEVTKLTLSRTLSL